MQLAPTYSNPFEPATTISFSLAQTEPVQLTVHNLLGEEVAVILDRLMEPGSHSASFDGAGLASGVYTYTLQVGGFIQTKTFSLVKYRAADNHAARVMPKVSAGDGTGEHQFGRLALVLVG
jgi:hypothetical protein